MLVITYICMSAAVTAKSLQSYLTLCDPIDSSTPGSPAPEILQTRVLEWSVLAFSPHMLLLLLLSRVSRV